MKATIRSLALLAWLVVLSTCGGGDSTPPVAVFITPTTVSLKPGEVQNFDATVTGTAHTGSGNSVVNWTVQEGATGGSVTDNGVYTPDITNGTFHVIATSQADTSKSATAIVTVSGPFLIAPANEVLGPLGVQAFSANAKVTWSVQEGAAGGLITPDGQYTAPNTPGLFHVVATSVVDPSKTLTANVTVLSSGFQATGNMSIGRTGHTATLLPSGKALVVGGDSCYFSQDYYSGNCPLDSAEIYDPASGRFTPTGKMAVQRLFHTATLLSTGKVLVTGGPDASAELYDPTSGKFTATGSMSVGRSSHSATLLTSGKVLIVGGQNVSGELATAELYDAASGTFTATGSMATPRSAHSATLLANGKVLITGGGNATDGAVATAEVYDPTTGSFASTGSLASARSNHATTQLANSKVLVIGGNDNTNALSSAELYDSVTGGFTPTGHMIAARETPLAIVLPNGAVLVAGGNISTAELYDTASATFSQTGNMQIPRLYPAAVLLPDGRVLVAGGSDSSSAELYK